ncbi:hypothetical protein IY145_19610 [Methylosinus sp. H3A]|uniref:hypothetical protein n=1 Tax=Methylosinus sp. H3A TaxID=2785786 RepID=UPI0018C3517B|nr:hypothetical protein [Methylosinus sp. H3A]MBG0811563.1 hypothetical protein [Methylosinus sp. H3A]
MRISATILSAALLAALFGLPGPSIAGARGPVVIRGLGPDDFTPRAAANFRHSRPAHPARRWREPEPAYARAAIAPPRFRVAAAEDAQDWRQSARPRYRASEFAPAPYIEPAYYAPESNPYDRVYRPGAYTAADPIPPRPGPIYGYYLDEGPFPAPR